MAKLKGSLSLFTAYNAVLVIIGGFSRAMPSTAAGGGNRETGWAQ
jgi:hypothetical protein